MTDFGQLTEFSAIDPVICRGSALMMSPLNNAGRPIHVDRTPQCDSSDR